MGDHPAKAPLVWRIGVVALLVAAAGLWFAYRAPGDYGARDAVGRESQDHSTNAPDAISTPVPPGIPTRSVSPNLTEVASRSLPRAAAQASDFPKQAAGEAQGASPLSAAGNSESKHDAAEGPDKSLMPRHWAACYPSANPANGGYLFASDDSTAWSGAFSARISSRVAQPNPAGAAFCQSIAATRFKGQRVEYSIHLRTGDAVPGAHIVFRAERADGRVLAFYNMAERWVRGTTDWKRFSVVIDVPEGAAVIFVGATLVGTGTLWMDDADLTSAPQGTPLTQRPPPANFYTQVVDASSLANELRNPGFEDTRKRGADGR